MVKNTMTLVKVGVTAMILAKALPVLPTIVLHHQYKWQHMAINILVLL